MGTITLNIAHNNSDSKYSNALNKLSGKGAYYITRGNTKVFSLTSNGDLGKEICIAKTNVGIKIESVVSIYNGRKVFKVICGSKYGYIPISDYSYWLGFIRTADLKNVGLVKRANATYTNLNNNNELNSDALVSGTSSDTQDAEDSESDSGGGTGSSTSGSSSDGDIEVTYEFAVKAAPSFAYNINEHLLDEANKGYDSFLNQIESGNGIDYSKLRNIFGAPYQFLPTTDCRVGSGFSDNLESAGYEFTEKILSRMPLLFITPGNTSFMGGSTENARTALLGNLDEGLIPNDVKENSLESMLSDYNGKLYTIMPAYAEYFNYVNPMCRAGAIFLGIGDEELFEQGKKLKEMHWGFNEGQAYEFYIEEEETEEEETEEEEEETENGEEVKEEEEITKEKYVETFEFTKTDGAFTDLQKYLYYSNAIPLYINSETSFQDSFSNETTESTLSSTINALSDRAREIQFLLGTASSAVGEAFDKVDGTLTAVKEQINSIVEKVAGGNSIFTTIANSVKTIVSGGRMLFPNIWSNSTFSKSYNISIKLVTPSYDKISWWLNIYVPLCHLMALVLPRSEYVNSYTTPFLVKAFYKGMFNIDMGIITDMTFTKGKEGSWTKDSLPTIVDVTFTIQDLYTGMGMTSTGNMFKGTTLQNISEMDYIANLCGININVPDTFRMVDLWATFNMTNRINDFLPNFENRVTNAINNKLYSMYDNFWF